MEPKKTKHYSTGEIYDMATKGLRCIEQGGGGLHVVNANGEDAIVANDAIRAMLFQAAETELEISGLRKNVHNLRKEVSKKQNSINPLRWEVRSLNEKIDKIRKADPTHITDKDLEEVLAVAKRMIERDEYGGGIIEGLVRFIRDSRAVIYTKEGE